MTVDYLVVGNGLAGALTAFALRKRGRSVLVVDDPAAAGSSRVAAGLINPVTGPRFALNRDVDRLLPEAMAFYQELEAELGIEVWSDLSLFRVFRSEQERERWDARRGKEAFAAYAGPLLESVPLGLPIQAPFGGAEIRGAARVDLGALIDGLDVERVRAPWSQAECRLEENGVGWRDVHAGCVVCCEGAAVRKNEWFRGIPWEPVKGEMLTIGLSGFPDDQVVVGGVTLVPLGGGHFYAGATYDREDPDAEPTPEGSAALCGRLDELLTIPYALVGHSAGIRPVTRRRTPVLGRHPELPRVAILNGLGSRGALAAPTCARQLVALLEDGQPPDRELDIKTHWTK